MKGSSLRKPLVLLLTAGALTIPNAAAFASAGKKVTTLRKSFTGVAGSADRWGEVEVQLVVRKTTTVVGTKKTVTKRIISIRIPVYPNHTDRSYFISQQSLPYLIQEALQAQSANVQMVSGATYTSQGFISSLQDAITKEKAW